MNNNRNQRLKSIGAEADKIVEEKGISPSEVSGYAVSMAAFGRKPNGDFYGLFDEWLKQRQAIPGSPPVDMPADAAAELEQWTNHLKAQIMQRVTGIVRGVAGSFEQTTTMRVIALERLCADQARRNRGVIETLVETEAELDNAQARIYELTDDLRQEREQVQRLLGRLEERDALFHALQPSAGTDSVAPVAQFDSGEHTSSGDEDDDANVGGGDTIGDVMVPEEPPVAEVRETRTANDDGETGATFPAYEPAARIGQVEMPLPVAPDPAKTDRVPD